jgi:hypothetical protein
MRPLGRRPGIHGATNSAGIWILGCAIAHHSFRFASPGIDVEIARHSPLSSSAKAEDLVRRGLSVQSLPSLDTGSPPSWGRQASMRLRSRGMNCPRFALISHPPIVRAQGRPGARRTRGLVCHADRKCAHEHTGSAGASRPSLRNGFTAYFDLSPENGSFASVAPEKLSFPVDLTPAPRRRDQTTSPYASATLVSRSIRVHRISPRVSDDGQRPSSRGETSVVMPLIWAKREAGNF